MEIFTLLTLIALGAYTLKSRYQNRRIALLGRHLGKYQIEKLMETLMQGYARALAEPDAERRAQIWTLLNTSELALSEEFNRFANDFSRVDEADARVSKLAFAIPHADKLFPRATFDLRRVFAVHAQGIRQAVSNRLEQSAKGKAFTLSAEMFLMQHTCHWFCRSKTVASARMLAAHQTSYAKLLASLAPETRQAYELVLAA